MALAASMMVIAAGSLAWAQAKTAQDFAAMAASSDMFEIQSSELCFAESRKSRGEGICADDDQRSHNSFQEPHGGGTAGRCSRAGRNDDQAHSQG
jgi:hypothetical protein